MGLIRGVARTAVIAGTATAVSNNVSRRQQRRWSDQEAEQQQAYYQEQPPPPAYYAVPAQAPEPAAEQAPSEDELTASLNRLADLHARGVLSDDEFSAAKAKLLGL